jgi:hypothetical protein
VELFGFEIKRRQGEEAKDVTSFAPVDKDDGAVNVSAGGTWGTYLDLEGAAKTEAELVAKYREMALQPECEMAIDEVVNEAISREDDRSIVDINTDELDSIVTPKIKKILHDEWTKIQEMLNFNNFGYEIFRRFYIDGRLYYHAMVDANNPREGIQQFRYIDPRKIRKVRSSHREKRGTATVTITDDEFYMYNEKGFRNTSGNTNDNQGLKITADSIIHITSGLMDKDGKLVLSYLHKAVKPLNQLRILEDATVIYRISRAPERRIFYIDVGNLPKTKAEEYVRDMMTKHKNRLVYDATTGETRDDRKFMTMLEDYWLPRREGGKGTEIATLPAGQNLGQMDDVLYFQKKLYKSLNVPSSRIEGSEQGGFNMGRSSEISRDELKFQKFINRLRVRFSQFMLDALKKQIILKGIMNTEEWDSISSKIFFEFAKDNYFAELKDAEILRERLSTLQMIDSYVGKYYSVLWVRKNILMQTDEDIEEMDDDNAQDEDLQLKLEQEREMSQQEVDAGQQQIDAATDGTQAPPTNTVDKKKSDEKKTPTSEKPKTKQGTSRAANKLQPYTRQTVQGSSTPYYRNVPKTKK